jgi:hypothetical protein
VEWLLVKDKLIDMVCQGICSFTLGGPEGVHSSKEETVSQRSITLTQRGDRVESKEVVLFAE